MTRHFSRRIRFGLLLCLTATLAMGCSGQDASQQDKEKSSDKRGTDKRSDKRDPRQRPSPGTPAGEDPEVAAYIKKKGWSLSRDLRIADSKPLIFLSLGNPGKPGGSAALTPDDYKMIAR